MDLLYYAEDPADRQQQYLWQLRENEIDLQVNLSDLQQEICDCVDQLAIVMGLLRVTRQQIRDLEERAA